MFTIKSRFNQIFIAVIIAAFAMPVRLPAEQPVLEAIDLSEVIITPDSLQLAGDPLPPTHQARLTIYDMPYSMRGSCHDWKRLWINTGVLFGAYVSTLGVLELLPEDATSWNRAEIISVPPFKRWWQHVSGGPEWDHDNLIFNYVLHPYAGAAYYMAARSCGFNVYQSFLYSACISTIGWEYGIEAFMEYPSWQDLFITPIVGSVIGECFYKVKRSIVANGYTLAGSKVLGNIVVFLVDPVNEVIGLFAGNPCRQRLPYSVTSPAEVATTPWIKSFHGDIAYGFSLTCTF